MVSETPRKMNTKIAIAMIILFSIWAIVFLGKLPSHLRVPVFIILVVAFIAYHIVTCPTKKAIVGFRDMEHRQLEYALANTDYDNHHKLLLMYPEEVRLYIRNDLGNIDAFYGKF